MLKVTYRWLRQHPYVEVSRYSDEVAPRMGGYDSKTEFAAILNPTKSPHEGDYGNRVGISKASSVLSGGYDNKRLFGAILNPTKSPQEGGYEM